MRFIISGPCALESFEQVKEFSDVAKTLKIPFVRAMLFKPRTKPESFQGLGEGGLPLVQFLISEGHRLCTEFCSEEQLKLVAQFADIVQIGARNMQNFELLKSIGRDPSMIARRPYVLLKRGFAAKATEWLGSADYLVESGIRPEQIILCERGSRNGLAPGGVTLDLGLAWAVRQNSGYPVICDPSHGSGDASLVLPLSRAIDAMGFDGLMVEAHPRPSESLSDAHQAIGHAELKQLIASIKVSEVHLKRGIHAAH